MSGPEETSSDPVRRLILDLVVDLAPAQVLQLDCGRGELGAELQSALGRPITAIDSSHWHVELARAGGVRAGVGHPAALPFEDASFDCVIHTRGYPPGPAEDVLHEIHRVLRPSGTLLAARDAFEPARDAELLRDLFATVTSEPARNGTPGTLVVAKSPQDDE